MPTPGTWAEQVRTWCSWGWQLRVGLQRRAPVARTVRGPDIAEPAPFTAAVEAVLRGLVSPPGAQPLLDP
jgi:hypothetical protein